MLAASSISHGKTSAYLPVIELLNGYFKILARDDPHAAKAKRLPTGFMGSIVRWKRRSHTCSPCSPPAGHRRPARPDGSAAEA